MDKPVSQDYQSSFATESVLMKLAGKFGLSKLRWSFRRLHCPVPKNALVLEVGAGGNPYPRANVLLDAMEDTIERNEKSLITDRPLVLGLCESLPFKDKSFDFVIASHVLEHTDNPEKFLSELMRISKAGYIETPEGWFEKMCAFTYHRLEVSNLNGKLLIRKKGEWKPEEIALLWDNKLANSKSLFDFLVSNPDLNHMRFYWDHSIDFEVVNPECDASWSYPIETMQSRSLHKTIKSQFRDIYLTARRWLYSQNSRNKKITCTIY
jgi:SAM-dependent methyltransferase